MCQCLVLNVDDYIVVMLENSLQEFPTWTLESNKMSCQQLTLNRLFFKKKGSLSSFAKNTSFQDSLCWLLVVSIYGTLINYVKCLSGLTVDEVNNKSIFLVGTLFYGFMGCLMGITSLTLPSCAWLWTESIPSHHLTL